MQCIYFVFGYNFKIPAIVFADRHRFLPTTFVCGPYKESLDTFSGNPFPGSVIISIGTIHSATNFSHPRVVSGKSFFISLFFSHWLKTGQL